ncbi:MAG: glycosyltransferase family 4 protein [Bacteroidaceae bacterium]|nr:glycosyltransferase family 4 protein [Bacteroidaceae bacterium]
MKKKTIIHVAPFPIQNMGKGKGRVSTYLILKGLVKNGYDNIYITNSPYASPDDSEPGIEVVKINDPFTKTSFAYTRLYMLFIYFPIIYPLFLYHAIRMAKNRNVVLVCCHACNLAFVGYTLAKIFKAKYVSKFYGIGEPSAPGHPDLLRKSAFWYPSDLFIITNDGSNGYEYALKRGVSPDKIAFLRNGIDKPENLKKDECLYKELAPNNEKLLLSVSRLVNSKNVDKIIEAFHGVSKILLNTRLIIVGDGLKRKELETKASQLGISDRISFVGAIYHKDVFRYQSIADIFISMNGISSLSNPVFEAMSCGKCVIALDRGATRDLIKDEENGIVVKSCEELKDAIIRLLSDPSLITRLGLEAKKTIATWPSWEERVQIEMEMINSLCGNNTPLITNRLN